MKNIFGIIIVLFLYVGCEEIDVLVLSDDVEIERYIADDDLGRVFFSQENLISEMPYYYPLDPTGYYVDLLDSIEREIIPYFPLKEYGAGYSEPTQEFGPPFGSSQDAEVTVHDRVYARTIRVEGVDTTVVNEILHRDYFRYGYFMKLGDDGQKFSGWLLRGFSGGSGENNTRMSMYHANNQWFSGDTLSFQHRTSVIVDNSSYPPDTIEHFSTRQGYLMLTGDPIQVKLIERVPMGEQLRSEITSTNLGMFYTRMYVSGANTTLENFGINSDSHYEILTQTPSVNTNTWDFIYFQEFVRDINDTTAVPRFQTFKRRNWIIPFKVE